MSSVAAEPGVESIRQRIAATLNDLSKRERRVAEYVLSNPAAVLFATVAEVAQRAGVVPATVVRFAQSLGFNGYTEFRDALRADAPFLRSPLERLDEEVAGVAATGVADVVERVRNQSFANLTQTFDQLDPRQIDAVVTYLLQARRVLVVGAGQSTMLALHLHRVLQTAQIASLVIRDWYDLLYEAANIQPADVVFGSTVWRYSKVTVEALRLARAAGARTIMLTDAAYAPAVDVVDLVLFYSPKAIGVYLSPVAGAAVIDAIAACLAARVPERVKRGMARQYELSAEHGLGYR